MWMKIQRMKTVIYSVTLLVAASSLMPIANAAEKLQTTLRVGAYFRAGHVPDGWCLRKVGDLSRQSQRVSGMER